MSKELTPAEKIEIFIIKNRTVSIGISVIVSLVLAPVVSEQLGLDLLSDESVMSALTNYFLVWLLCVCLAALTLHPLITFIQKKQFASLYRQTENALSAVSIRQAKIEARLELVSIIAILVLAIVYTYYPLPIVLTSALCFGATSAFIWVLQNQRERIFIDDEKRKVFYNNTEVFIVVIFFVGLLLCHLIMTLYYVSSLDPSSDPSLSVIRSVRIIQYIEAVILGYILTRAGDYINGKISEASCG